MGIRATPAVTGELSKVSLEFDDLVPAILLYRAVEAYGVRKTLKWQPYSHYFMDFRSYNIEVIG